MNKAASANLFVELRLLSSFAPQPKSSLPPSLIVVLTLDPTGKGGLGLLIHRPSGAFPRNQSALPSFSLFLLTFVTDHTGDNLQPRPRRLLLLTAYRIIDRLRGNKLDGG